MIPSTLAVSLYIESLISWSKVRLPIDEANRFGIRQTTLNGFLQSSANTAGVPANAYNLTEDSARRIYSWYLLNAVPHFNIQHLKRLKTALQLSHIAAMFGHDAAARTLQRSLLNLATATVTVNGKLDKTTIDLIETVNPHFLTGRIFTQWILLVDGYCSSLEREAFRLDWIRRAVAISYEDLEIGN